MNQNVNKLPHAYVQQMKAMLPNEADAFLNSYDQPRAYGLRVHPAKWLQHETARTRAEEMFQLRPVPWYDYGYYYAEHTRPGRHAYHAVGLYYIQEPSAMSAVALLDPKPGECVLDLAAAPGGKSTQIAGMLQGDGLLIANEIHRDRARILAENVERMGARNVIVTNSDPDSLAERFTGAFDCIMLDAPCSGEGMFRKDPDAIQEWSPDHVTMCANRQWDIIQAAVRMLRPGGRIGYSTCTFNEQENEQILARWIQEYPQFQIERTERIWPHHQEGEGHFVAVLRLTASLEDAETALSAPKLSLTSNDRRKGKKRSGGRQQQTERTRAMSAKEAFKLFTAWADDAIPGWTLPQGEPILFGDELYWLPAAPAASTLNMSPELLEGMRVPRPGLHLAHIRKQRIEPAHALALSFTQLEEASLNLNLNAAADDAYAYLSGQTLPLPASMTEVKGWVLIGIDGLPAGWGKASNGIVKNHYPKGLRMMNT